MDYNTTGAMRSPFSPRVRQSITGRRPISLSSAKKNQSKSMQSPGEPTGDVVYKTPVTTIETYGMPLPVMVTEALTFASGEVSVRLSACGWCWVVSGRRIIAWPRNSSSSSNAAAVSTSTVARELSLPQTDLAHKADLVVLFYTAGAQMPSCIGVSPEGTVRYWPSVGQEGVYVDVSCELAGQECEKLGDYTPEGIVLATTTCTVVLLNPTEVDGRATVTCRTLRPPSGWLGGIGRRVSLLFFGSMPAHADTKLVGVVVLPGEAGGEPSIALVSRGPALQLWRGAELHEHSLRRALGDAHARTHLPPHGDPNSLEIMALDVRASGNNGLLLLIAIVNIARSPEMRYGIAHVCVEDASAPRVSWLVLARGVAAAPPAPPAPPLPPGAAPDDLRAPDEAPRFLPLPQRALLYTSKYIALVSTTMSNDKVDYIDVSSEGDKLLGAELCDGVPLLFSLKHGVLALSQPDAMHNTPSMCESPMGSPCPSDMYDGNLSLYEIDPHEVGAVGRDAVGRLKTAFLFHVRRDASSCAALLAGLVPPAPASPGPASPGPAPPGPAPAPRDVDADLDRAVLRIASDMLDDVPAGDPRWKQRGGAATNICLGSSAALQLQAQLRDKQRALALFCDFLRSVGLWQRLGLVTTESGSVVSTENALAELADLLSMAIALRKLQQGPDAQLIDAAINQVVCGDGALQEEPELEAALAGGALAPSDVCYRRVTRVARVLRALARASRPAAPRAAALHAAATLRALLAALGARARRARPPPALGPAALLPALAALPRRALAAAREAEDGALRAAVGEAAAALADAVLWDADALAADPATLHHYQRLRRDTIQPFIDDGQTERAAALAEKFKDFELLIEMCIDNNDLERLYSYIEKYSNEGFAERVFARLCERGGAGRALLLRGLGARCGGALAAWLAAAPPRAPLLALQALGARRPARAAAALLATADMERDSVARLTTAASLGKLCAVAAEEDTESLARRLDARLALASQHAALPAALRLRHGLGPADCAVLPPDDLVQMYIDSESKELTEYDYKKALDLTDFVEDTEKRDDLRLRVWCACILADDWSSVRMDAPAQDLADKMFFRLIDLVHLMGADVSVVVPPAEDVLTAPELAELAADSRFHYLLRYGYQCLPTGTH